jgi:hypothetical protein
MKYLGVWYQSGGAVNSKQGEYIGNRARGVVGRISQVGCFEGGLSPSVALDHAETKFISTVSYGCIAWAYVNVMGNGIGVTAARVVERAQLSLARAVLNAPKKMPAPIVLGEAGWMSVTLQWAVAVLQEWGTIMAAPDSRTDRAVLVGDVAAAQAGGKCSELGVRVVGAAELIFGLGGGHELNFRNKAAWKKKLKKAVAVAAQEEYERMLRAVGGGLGDAYLAIKPKFGRAPWLDTARCSVRWGRRQSIYQLIRLRGAGHHLRTVTCYYWWTHHDDQCPCGQHRQDPPHWLFGCD